MTKRQREENLVSDPVGRVKIGEEVDGDLSREASRAEMVKTWIGMILAGVLIVAGLILALLGVGGQADWLISGPGIAAKATNASPGILLVILGISILITTRLDLVLE